MRKSFAKRCPFDFENFQNRKDNSTGYDWDRGSHCSTCASHSQTVALSILKIFKIERATICELSGKPESHVFVGFANIGKIRVPLFVGWATRVRGSHFCRAVRHFCRAVRHFCRAVRHFCRAVRHFPDSPSPSPRFVSTIRIDDSRIVALAILKILKIEGEARHRGKSSGFRWILPTA